MIEMSKIIEEEKPKSVDLKRTKAELAFQKMQEKMVTLTFNLMSSTHCYQLSNLKDRINSFFFLHPLQQTERIKQKASMTHKQRVEEFNRHLDSLTEHFDIPKVSWTK